MPATMPALTAPTDTSTSRARSRLGRAAGTAVAVVLTAALAGACSGEGDPSEAPSPSADGSSGAVATPSATPTEPAYLPVPEGVELTEPGSELELDEGAVVAWEPRQRLVGVLEIKVEQLLRTTIEESFEGWQLEKQVPDPAPYFVTASVRNVGDTDLGGQRVPLYIVDGRDRLIESSRFAERFEACPSTPFPKSFAPGDQVDVCLVYLAPNDGRLRAVSFRPHEEFDPITWIGRLRPLDKRRDDPGGTGDKGSDKGSEKGSDKGTGEGAGQGDR